MTAPTRPPRPADAVKLVEDLLTAARAANKPGARGVGTLVLQDAERAILALRDLQTTAARLAYHLLDVRSAYVKELHDDTIFPDAAAALDDYAALTGVKQPAAPPPNTTAATLATAARAVLAQWDAFDETGPIPADELMEELRAALGVYDRRYGA